MLFLVVLTVFKAAVFGLTSLILSALVARLLFMSLLFPKKMLFNVIY